ncbi:MAG: efflux RND transporter periplasmic adaptor subunit [Paludisphaera borealis]|uniref:efflux RND transporter periplasmic adaptor subunit n=1 Tax=Paludisphaera borealis TaxID=1387353 RepID=UPI002851C7D9|nr:efflux RND transporter periplasmic adaptor subunit [Paludisphaera borealis]MDR3618189.1 efflux RND transporter periplasmic adaptor subunit [Paludisphaera borealis]
MLAAAVVAGVSAAAWYTHIKEATAASRAAGSSNTPEGQQADEPIPVETVRLTKGGIIRTSTQIGSVHPYEEADLFAKISGYLSKLNVNYGDSVKQDQVLAEIDDPEVEADAEKAVADVRQAVAASAQTEAFIEVAKADREAAASAVEQATSEVERFVSMSSYHSKKFERYRRLVQSKAVPQEIADEEEESYESARSNEHAARHAVLKAKADLIAAEARIKKAKADLDEARANISVAEAKRARAEALLGYTKIHSPYDGVVTKRNFFRGAFIRSAAEGGVIPLLTVARTDKVYVVTEVPDRDVPLTDVGDTVEITLDALGTEVFKAKVSRIAEREDPTTRTMHTEIDLPNPENRIRPGMYGIAKIILDMSTKNSTLPASCLVGESRGGRADVYLIKDGKAKKTAVAVGADDGIRVEILSGVEPEDEVLTNPSSVSEGIPVRGAPQEAGDSEPAEASPTEHAPNK